MPGADTLSTFQIDLPDQDAALALAGEGGLGVGANLKMVDAFIEGLRS